MPAAALGHGAAQTQKRQGRHGGPVAFPADRRALPAGAVLRDLCRQDRSVPLQSRAARSWSTARRCRSWRRRPKGSASASRRSARPGISRAYFLGADDQGRDVAARLLYGGRNSLLIAGASTLICLILAAIVGLVAGFFGGCDRLGAVALPRRALGLSRLSAGDFALDRADQPRHRHRADFHQCRQPVAADLHHRHHLRALCGAADPRPGAVADAKASSCWPPSASACRRIASCCATSCPT